MFENKMIKIAEKMDSFKFMMVYSLFFSFACSLITSVTVKVLFSIDMSISKLMGFIVGSIFRRHFLTQ